MSDETLQPPAAPEVVSTAPAPDPAPVSADHLAHPVVAQVVQSVYSDPNVNPSGAAYVAASILNGIAQYAPAVLQLTRASPQTSMWTNIGIGGLATIIAAFFPHPKLTE